MKQVGKPAIWAFYLVIIFEILFMISPFALYFYSVYASTLNVLHRWPETAWLTKFFLPDFSQTHSLWLNVLPMLAWCLISVGLLLFLGAAVPLYWAQFRGRGVVSRGLSVDAQSWGLSSWATPHAPLSAARGSPDMSLALRTAA